MTTRNCSSSEGDKEEDIEKQEKSLVVCSFKEGACVWEGSHAFKDVFPMSHTDPWTLIIKLACTHRKWLIPPSACCPWHHTKTVEYLLDYISLQLWPSQLHHIDHVPQNLNNDFGWLPVVSVVHNSASKDCKSITSTQPTCAHFDWHQTQPFDDSFPCFLHSHWIKDRF